MKLDVLGSDMEWEGHKVVVMVIATVAMRVIAWMIVQCGRMRHAD